MGHNYKIYAEPVNGAATAGDFALAVAELCGTGASAECLTPAMDTNFSVRVRPAGP